MMTAVTPPVHHRKFLSVQFATICVYVYQIDSPSVSIPFFAIPVISPNPSCQRPNQRRDSPTGRPAPSSSRRPQGRGLPFPAAVVVCPSRGPRSRRHAPRRLPLFLKYQRCRIFSRVCADVFGVSCPNTSAAWRQCGSRFPTGRLAGGLVCRSRAAGVGFPSRRQPSACAFGGLPPIPPTAAGRQAPAGKNGKNS